MELCNWLEKEGDIYSASELYEQMISLPLSNTKVYSSHQYLKKKLREKYNETIFFREINGKSDDLCFRDTVSEIRGHPLSTYAKFSEKLTFQSPWYAHVCVRIRGLEMLVFWKILRTYLIDGP